MASGYTEKIRRYDLSFYLGNGTKTGSVPEITLVRSDRSEILTDWVDRGPPVRNFRQLIASCRNATTPLSGDRVVCESQSGYWKRIAYTASTDQYARHERIGDMLNATVNNALPSFTGLSDADDQAKMDFVRNARSAQTSIQGGVVLGELRETLNMLKNPAKALRQKVDDYFNALKKRRRGSSSQRRRTLSETWLEHSFGWKPLINDISDAGKLVNRMLYYPTHIPVRGLGRAETDIPSTEYLVNYFSAGNGRVGRQQKSYSIVIYRGAVKLDTSDKLGFTMQQAGLTIDQFVPTLYNLIPYSFLVDYFTNIGDILDCWSFGRGSLGWSNKTTIEVVSCELTGLSHSFTFGPTQKAITQECRLGRHKFERRRISRASYSGTFVPDFRFEVPGLGSLKWVNLLALGRTHRSLTPY